MKFDKETWRLAQILDSRLHEFTDIGSKREFFAKELNIPEQTARAILYALENRDLIAGTPEVILAKDGDVEFGIGDLHIPFVDRYALDTSINYAIKHHNVNRVTLNGDIFDFYKSSYYKKNPTKGVSILEEFNQTREILEYIRKAFPDAYINFLKGNHCKRFIDCIDSKAPDYHELFEGMLQNILGFNELNIDYKDNFYKYGELYHIHGHEVRCSGGVVNICKVLMSKILHNFVTWHFHTSQEHIVKRIDNSILGGWAVGHLATDKAFEDYAQINNWNQGFAIIEYDSNGEFTMHNKKICKGKIY